MSIVQNRKAFHDYFVEERFETGLVLEGWEVKAIRAGRAQIAEAYVVVRNAALWLLGAHISALPTASVPGSVFGRSGANSCSSVSSYSAIFGSTGATASFFARRSSTARRYLSNCPVLPGVCVASYQLM